MSSVAMKSLLPPPEHVLAGCCLPRIDGKPALMPPPEAPKANFIEQSVEKLKAVGVATADGAAFVGKKSLEGAKAVGDGAKAVGDGVSNLVVTGLQAVFGEDAKMEASSVVAGAPRRSELDAAVAKVAAYEHYMLCTEGATDEFSELLRSSLGVTQRQHQILARLLLHTEGCPVPMRRDTVQRWLPAYRAIVLIQASALSADSVSSSFLARQRLLLVLALDGTEGSASVANTIDLYAARLLESHTERAQDDAPLPIDFIAPIDAATVATTAAADTGGNEWQMAIWDTLTVTKALEDPWPSPLAFQLYAELVRAVALEPLLEPALSRTAEGGAVEGPGGGGGGGGHGGQWYGWRPATNEAQSRALPALHRVWPSLRLDARTHALAHLHVLLTSFDARVHALRTFSEVQPLETAWQEQLNTALSAAVWAELTHTSSADEDAEADARAAHAVAAKARFDHLVPRCATLGDSGVAAATLIQRTAREVALTRRLREYERRPRHPWRAADRLASTSAALAAELAEVLRDFRYLGGCSGRVELPRLVGTWRLAALTAIVLNRAGPTERAAALQHLQSILTPGAKSDARSAISSSGRIMIKFQTPAKAAALRELLGSSERKVEALTTALIARSVASHVERLRALGNAMSHAALAPVAQGPTSAVPSTAAAAVSPYALCRAPQPPNHSSKRNIFEQSVDKVKAVGTATVDGAKAVGTATLDGAKAVGTATLDGAKAVGTATRDAAAAAATGDKEAVAKAVAMGAGVTAATALAVVRLPVALPAAAAVASVAAAHVAVATAATATAAGAATAAAATAPLPAAAAVAVGAHATAVAAGVGAAATAGAVALGKSGTGVNGFEGTPLRSAWLEKLPSWEIGDEL